MFLGAVVPLKCLLGTLKKMVGKSGPLMEVNGLAYAFCDYHLTTYQDHKATINR